MERFVLSLAICSAAMTAVSLLYMGVCRLFGRRWSPKWRYYLWLLPLAGFMTPVKPRIAAPIAEVGGGGQTVYFAVGVTEGLRVDVWAVALAVWAAGFACVLAYVLIRHRRLVSRLERYAAAPPAEMSALLAEVSAGLGVSPPRLAIVPRLGAPMMIGIVRPSVYLPGGDFGGEALRMIFKHELVHLRRRDLLYKLLIILCRAGHWFNPFMPFICRSVERVCEMSCDEAVVGGEPPELKKIYCGSILDTVKRRNDLNNNPLCTGFGCEKRWLSARLSMIFAAGRGRGLAAVGAAVLAVTLFAGAALTVAGPEPGAEGGGDFTFVVTTTYTQNNQGTPAETTSPEGWGGVGTTMTMTAVPAPLP